MMEKSISIGSPLMIVDLDLFVENVKFIHTVFPNPRVKVHVGNRRFDGRWGWVGKYKGG